MTEDPLAEATRALRETEEISEFEARATRARVMTGLHQTRVRRRTRLAFLLPIAASFVAVSAWGAASGKARRVLEDIERMVGVSVNTSSSTKATTSRRSAAPLREAAPSLPASSVTAESLPSVPSEAGIAGPPRAAPSAPSATPSAPHAPSALVNASAPRATPNASASPSRSEGVDPTLALYRIAHKAHFVDRDPARALAAWDAYLSAAPNGAFAPEARYNRALSLVRLSRRADARSALAPFANGAYGGYRKAEARALLERIGP